MAMVVRTVIPGTYVYLHCRPLNAGVILSDEGPEIRKGMNGTEFETSFRMVRIHWVDGTKSTCSTAGLKSFDQLIIDTQRKLSTHFLTLKKLDELKETVV